MRVGGHEEVVGPTPLLQEASSLDPFATDGRADHPFTRGNDASPGLSSFVRQEIEGRDRSVAHDLLVEVADELVAEKREQWLRKLLDTFAAAMDNHRTDRADDRAASRFGASGHVPEER